MASPVPDFLVIGAEKAATTWLADTLRRHPRIFMPATKEIHYFNRYNSNQREIDNYRYGIDWYSKFFERAGHRIAGEATPMYLCDEHAARRIQSDLPAARLIAVLRDPVGRTISHYRMAIGKGHTDADLARLVRDNDPRFVVRSDYGPQLRRYEDTLHDGRLLVVAYERLFEPATLARVCTHIGVDPTELRPDTTRVVNPPHMVRSTTALAATTATARAMHRTRATSALVSVAKQLGLSQIIRGLNRRDSAPAVTVPAETLELLQERFRHVGDEVAGLTGQDFPWSR